jgi:putative membrane protein
MRLRDGLMIGSVGAVLTLTSGVAQSAGTEGADVATVLRNLHAANQMEIAAGKLAKEKGQTVEIQAFGATLVADHTSADKKVVALAAEKNIELPAQVPMPRDEKRDMRALSAAKGAAFDELFAAEMLADHQEVLADAKAARDQTSDTKLKTLLEVTLPVLEAHQQTSQALVDLLGPSAIAAAKRRR